MTMLMVRILSPEARKGQNTTLLLSEGSCKVGDEKVDMKSEGIRYERVQLHADDTFCTHTFSSICLRDKHTVKKVIFLEENDGAPGTEWRFEVLREVQPRPRKHSKLILYHTDGTICVKTKKGCKRETHYTREGG